MGAEHGARTGLVTRCCQGASFGLGFALTAVAFVAMFWIVWCYFGLTVVQISDTQRRAVPSYYTPSKPSPTPTSSPVRSTTPAIEETSINSISKSPTQATLLRGSSRGEMPIKVDIKKKEAEVLTSLAKGDPAPRERVSHSVSSSESRSSASTSASQPRGPPRPSDARPPDAGQKAAILSGSASEESADDRVYARRVMPPGAENRPEDASEDPRPDIAPTKVYEEVQTGSSRRSADPEVERSPAGDGPREYVDRNKDLPSRKDDDPVRRDEADREYSRRYDRERPKYDDDYDDRGSRSRYDRRDPDRVRDPDDPYPKGDTRPYVEDRIRDRPIEKYPDDVPRRLDDDRYRDERDRPRTRDRDYVSRDRVVDDRDERYRDDDRYPRKNEDKYVPRDDDRYRSRVDDRYKDDERYRSRDDEAYKADERYRAREDRYRDDERFVPRPEDRSRDRKDDKYRLEDDERYRSRDDRYRPRDDDRYRPRDDDDRYRPREDDERYRAREGPRDDDRYLSVSRTKEERDKIRPRDDDRVIDSRGRDDRIRETATRSREYPIEERSSSRSYSSVRDYDVPPREKARDTLSPSRVSRPLPDEDRYADRRYDDDRRIAPTRTRAVDDFDTKSAMVEARPKDDLDDVERRRDDRYRTTRIQGSRGSPEPGSASRRVVDDKDSYNTRPSNAGTAEKNENSREEVVLDRRSYSAEEEDEYRRRGDVVDERSRRPAERRRYRDDERYVARDPVDDRDEYKSPPSSSGRPRDGGYDYDRPRSRDRYDDAYDRPSTAARDDPPVPVRKYDDAYDRPSAATRDDPPVPVRKYDDDDRPRARDPDLGAGIRQEDGVGRSRTRSEDRYYERDAYPDSRPPQRRTYDDEDDYDDDRRRRQRPRETMVGSSSSSGVYAREPGDVVTREKRFPNPQSSRVTSVDAVDRSRGHVDAGGSRSRDEVRPLSPKDVIEAAIRQADTEGSQGSRSVYYPVFDPRSTNLTSPELIRPSERRGTTITARKKRSVQLFELLHHGLA